MNELDALAVPLAGTNLIEASAGTGKTQTITTLYVRLILEADVEVGDILVVTYTNAATAELRTRIRERLARALAAVEREGTGPSGDDAIDQLLAARRKTVPRELDRGRLTLALRDFDQGAIHTIHGFCQRVLREHAFESGASFDTELLTDQTTLLEEVVQDFWVRELSAASDLVVGSLGARKNEYADLVTLATRAGANPDLDVLPRVVDADLEAGLAAWRPAFERVRQLWQAGGPSVIECLLGAVGGLKKNQYREEEIRAWQGALDLAFGIDEPLMGARFPKLGKLGTAALESGTKQKGVAPRHEFFLACNDLLAAEAALRERVAARLLRFRVDLVDYVRAELPRRKEAANVQYFDDLLYRLERALGGPGGGLLAERVRERFPAALIDEFQDTDPVQYSIFHRLYHGAPAAALFLIGDPKQAIYAFRGADVFAYMKAKRDAASGYTLQTNWRSDPRLLEGVNYLFDRIEAPFVFDAIPYRRLRPRPEVAGTESAGAPLSILFATNAAFEAGGAMIHKGLGWKKLPGFVAAEISRLLAARPRIGGRDVAPSDIAVLCRTNWQAADVQVALRELGVPSVLQGDASVFDTPEAAQLQRVVAALAEPGDRAALRAAMATPVIGVRGEELHALQDDQRAWDGWATSFQTWNDVWRRRGFIPAFRRLLEEREVHVRLLGLADGERRLTNVLHLGELLQTAVRETRRGPLALVEWLGRMRSDAEARAELGSEAAQIRLESDERALRLTTIHKSKGLEYGVVFAPYLWDGKLLMQSDEKILRFHDPKDADRLKLDVGSPERSEIRAIAEREALAENLRLLYVALTRARHACTVVWGPFRDAGTSALGYLLHGRPKGAPGAEAAQALCERIVALGGSRMRAEIERLASGSAGAIEVRDLSTDPGIPYQPDEPPPGELDWRRTTRVLAQTWRTGSFSSLVAGGSPVSSPAEEGIDHDDAAEPLDAVAVPLITSDVTLADFPSGPRSGRLVHEIFERLDFRAGDAGIAASVAGALTSYGMGVEWAASLCPALGEVLDTPLDDGEPPLRLRDVPLERRLAEVEFVFPVAEAAEEERARMEVPRPPVRSEAQIALPFAKARLAPSFTNARLADVLELRAGELLSRPYLDSVRRLGFRPLAGFLKGYIDLVFEHGGRWWVVDYKSNLLGRQAQSYGPRQIARAMEQHHYFLQYHLYVVALHRYLQLRVKDYDYERHFGGVLYLFLRGMSPAHPRGCGVFRDRPPRAVVEELSHALARPASRGVA